MKAVLSEVLHNFNGTTVILLQKMVTYFGNILIIDKIAIIDNSEKGPWRLNFLRKLFNLTKSFLV